MCQWKCAAMRSSVLADIGRDSASRSTRPFAQSYKQIEKAGVRPQLRLVNLARLKAHGRDEILGRVLGRIAQIIPIRRGLQSQTVKAAEWAARYFQIFLDAEGRLDLRKRTLRGRCAASSEMLEITEK